MALVLSEQDCPWERPPVRITYRTGNGVRAPLYELYYCTACADIGLKERKTAALQEEQKEGDDSRQDVAASTPHSMNPLRSAHPIDTVSDIEAFYCPHTLEQFTSQEAMGHNRGTWITWGPSLGPGRPAGLVTPGC